MTGNPQDRIDRLVVKWESLPIDERESFFETLSEDARAAVRKAQLRRRDGEADPDDAELGGEA
jgi:hypothetical protein